MQDYVSVVMPAYDCEKTITRAAASVLAQSHSRWELIIVADDARDYQAILARQGIDDNRLTFLSTGATGSGSPPARNIGLDAAQYRYSAILDADDMMHPEKLALCIDALKSHGIVSTGLQVTDQNLDPLRQIGIGADRILPAPAYKFTNVSMDSMLVYDRHVADPRFEPDFPCLTDIAFLLRLFEHNTHTFHFGRALHTYVKEPKSVSNRPGASRQMVEMKERLLDRFGSGYYEFADPLTAEGMTAFYQASLKAEESYASTRAERPGLLFEDHLETFLNAASTSWR